MVGEDVLLVVELVVKVVVGDDVLLVVELVVDDVVGDDVLLVVELVVDEVVNEGVGTEPAGSCLSPVMYTSKRSSRR